MTAVPRKREAVMSGVEIARRGGHAADPIVKRREALALIRESAFDAVSRSSDETARLLELAAANPQLRSGPLLEAYGQGAVGPVRTLAWWRRNGCRVAKGQRGIAVSMFGAYVFGRNQVVGPDPGMIGVRESPPNALPEIGEGYGMAILAARAGVRLRAEWSQPDPFTGDEPMLLQPALVPPIASLAVLERALESVRAYDATADSCLSCDGAGCVLCSCQDDRERVSVKPSATVSPMPRAAETVPVKVKPIGRPVKARPPLPDVAKAFRQADRLEQRAKTVRVQAIRDAVAAGHSLGDVGAALGLSRARIHQLLHGR